MQTSTRPGVVEPEVIAQEQLEATKLQADAAVEQVALARRHLALTYDNFRAAFIFGWIGALTASVVAAATVVGLWMAAHRATLDQRAQDPARTKGASLGVPQNREDVRVLAARIEENERHIAAVKDDLTRIQSRATSGTKSQPGPSPMPKVAVAIAPPRQLIRVEPRYPELAPHQRVYANVNITYAVEVDGTVSILSRTGNALFLAAAVEAVSQWRFTPAWQGGHRVRYTQTVSIFFDPTKP